MKKLQITVYHESSRKPFMKVNIFKITDMHASYLINPLHLSNSVINPRAKIENVHNFISVIRLYFLHGSLGSPLLSAIKQAAQAGFLISCPENTPESLSKHKNPNTLCYFVWIVNLRIFNSKENIMKLKIGNLPRRHMSPIKMIFSTE